MQKPFIITAEITCDLPEQYSKENNIHIFYMAYTLNDVAYDGTPENCLDPVTFYKKVKEGQIPITSQVTLNQFLEGFEALYNQGFDILHLGFSTALSGSCNNAFMAKKELEEKYPDCKIVVIDTLCASLGQGLLINKAVELKNSGKTIEQVASEIESKKLNLLHYFTVDDLNHLYRGGRVSKTAAVVGSMLGIKPILHVNDDGKLIPIGKVRGRKAALLELVNQLEPKIKGFNNDVIYISHGDCEDDANFVSEEIKKRFGINKFLIGQIGCIVGTHSGQGTVAVFAFGDKR